jgi:hypothetical protein
MTILKMKHSGKSTLKSGVILFRRTNRKIKKRKESSQENQEKDEERE